MARHPTTIRESIESIILGNATVKAEHVFTNGSSTLDAMSLRDLKLRVDELCSLAIKDTMEAMANGHDVQAWFLGEDDNRGFEVGVEVESDPEEKPKKKPPKRKSPELVARAIELGLEEGESPKMVLEVIKKEFPDEDVSYSTITRIISQERKYREAKAQLPRSEEVDKANESIKDIKVPEMPEEFGKLKNAAERAKEGQQSQTPPVDMPDGSNGSVPNDAAIPELQAAVPEKAQRTSDAPDGHRGVYRDCRASSG